MRYLLIPMLLSGLLYAAESGTQPKTVYGLDGKWVTDYKRALASAKANDKLILANFTGSDWCPWCMKLKEEVFSDSEFEAWAKGRVVLLEVDYPRRKPQSESLKAQNRELATKYKIGGFPTVLVIDKGEKVLRQWGYYPGGFEKWVDGMVKGGPGLESLKR